MTEIMPVPRNLILLSYQQRAFLLLGIHPGNCFSYCVTGMDSVMTAPLSLRMEMCMVPLL